MNMLYFVTGPVEIEPSVWSSLVVGGSNDLDAAVRLAEKQPHGHGRVWIQDAMGAIYKVLEDGKTVAP